MRGVVALLVVVLVAGCSDSGGGEGSGTTTTTDSVIAPTTGPLAVTASGLPFVNVAADTDLTVSLAADGTVHRLRLVLFDRLTFDEVFDPDEDDDNGGGGFGGNNDDPPKEFGIAVFPVDGDPAKSGPCAEAGKVWDGRVHTDQVHIELATGLQDLWVWSSGPTKLAIAVSGGGDAKNHTAQAYNWTSTATAPAVTKSGPAQTTGEFTEAVSVVKGALILARFTAPNGYPDEQASLDIALEGAACATGVGSDGGGGGGGGNGFTGTTLRAAAFVGPGEATVSGVSTSTLSPTGEGTASVVVVAPK